MTTMAKTEIERVTEVIYIMADIFCDASWLTVDPEDLLSWLDTRSDLTARELAEQLIEQSVEPCHCKHVKP
jgi:hypothetical protein